MKSVFSRHPHWQYQLAGLPFDAVEDPFSRHSHNKDVQCRTVRPSLSFGVVRTPCSSHTGRAAPVSRKNARIVSGSAAALMNSTEVAACPSRHVACITSWSWWCRRSCRNWAAMYVIPLQLLQNFLVYVAAGTCSRASVISVRTLCVITFTHYLLMWACRVQTHFTKIVVHTHNFRRRWVLIKFKF